MSARRNVRGIEGDYNCGVDSRLLRAPASMCTARPPSPPPSALTAPAASCYPKQRAPRREALAGRVRAAAPPGSVCRCARFKRRGVRACAHLAHGGQHHAGQVLWEAADDVSHLAHALRVAHRRAAELVHHIDLRVAGRGRRAARGCARAMRARRACLNALRCWQGLCSDAAPAPAAGPVAEPPARRAHAANRSIAPRHTGTIAGRIGARRRLWRWAEGRAAARTWLQSRPGACRFDLLGAGGAGAAVERAMTALLGASPGRSAAVRPRVQRRGASRPSRRIGRAATCLPLATLLADSACRSCIVATSC